jgi:hypothetical protein
MKEKMKITDLKALIYADGIMIQGDTEELKIRSAHWERESNNYGLQINLEKTVILRLLNKQDKTQ